MPAAGGAGRFRLRVSTKTEMAAYAQAVLERLHAGRRARRAVVVLGRLRAGLANEPPFDRAPHELRFGIVRADGSLKPVADVLSAFARERRGVVADPSPFIVDEDIYYATLPASTGAEYAAYCAREELTP